ncbi:hypothetical protein T01_4006 [Trichinella spiralis]|uniref:Uncharacterized protein n=1 Tax=Trichinella spiralis TaxID=6334 RepID=A0A0V1AJD8_TRISP|nr:hypothetical protein T01_4006 [Trichinella spiralis]
MAELLHLAWASRCALISTCSSCNENSMFAFPVSMSNGAIIQSGTVMLSRSSKRIAKLLSSSTPYGTP